MDTQKKLAYLRFLKKFVTKERQEKIKQVLDTRISYVTVVLEDMCHSQNVAAVMRTCEAMGLQEVHAIELDKALDIKTTVARGSLQWMTLHRYTASMYQDPTAACIKKLQQDGYRVVATSPHATKKLSEVSLDTKLAFVFGTENSGLTPECIALADDLIALPQYGFVESLNVAVCAALCVYDVTTRLRSTQSASTWGLTEQQKADYELEWLEHSLDRPEVLKRVFLQEYPTSS